MSVNYRGEMAPLSIGNENPASLTNKQTKVDHEIDDAHAGATVGTVWFDGSEFSVRLFVANRDWHFRNISYEGLRWDIARTFPRLRLTLKRTRSCDLALRGTSAMLGG